MNPSRDDSSGYGEQHPQHQKVDLAGDEGKVSSDGKSERKFPWILHRLMEEAERENRQDVIAWMPSGNAFIVRKRDVFMKEILPRYFRQTKFKSFVRQLNLWGFLFIDHGPDKGSYHNKHFVKGKPWLCHDMRRLKAKGGVISSVSDPLVPRDVSQPMRSSRRTGTNAGRKPPPTSSPISSFATESLYANPAESSNLSTSSTSISIFPPTLIRQPSLPIQGVTTMRSQLSTLLDGAGSQSHQSTGATLSAINPFFADFQQQHRPHIQIAEPSSGQIHRLAVPTRYPGSLMGFHHHDGSLTPFSSNVSSLHQHPVIPDPNFLQMNRGNNDLPSTESSIPSSLRASFAASGMDTYTSAADGRAQLGPTLSTPSTDSSRTGGDWFDRLEAAFNPNPVYGIPHQPGRAVMSSSVGASVSAGGEGGEMLRKQTIVNPPGLPSWMGDTWNVTMSDLEPRPFRSSDDAGPSSSMKNLPPLIPSSLPGGGGEAAVGKPKRSDHSDEETDFYGFDQHQRTWKGPDDRHDGL